MVEVQHPLKLKQKHRLSLTEAGGARTEAVTGAVQLWLKLKRKPKL
ncbi:hypothetical protein ACFFOP_31540 [Sinosporangium siamense]